jgi:hypothetical protein
LRTVSEDYYTAARLLATELADNGLTSWAVSLEDILDAGTMATEVLMGLRSTLRQLIEAQDAHLTDDLRSSASELATSLDAALS